MLRRRVPFTQLAMATLLGVAGGLYIYRPYFEMKTPEKPEQKEVKKEKEPVP